MSQRLQESGRRSRLLLPGTSASLGVLFLGLALVMGVVGGALALLIRTQLSAAGEEGILQPETYLSLVSMHGSLMVFSVALPALFAGIGALALPAMLARTRLAWHALHRLSFWLLAAAQLILLASFLLEAGAAGAGWASLPPLSALEPKAWDGQDLWSLGMGLACVSYLLVSLVYARTLLALSGPHSMFVHAYRLAAGSGLVCMPVMLLGLCLLCADRHLGTSYFMPASMVLNDLVLPHEGGLPFLFRSLFWHQGHPATLLLSLPALGVALEITRANSAAELFGRRSSLWAMRLMTLGTLVFWALGMLESKSVPYPSVAGSPLALVSVACLLIVGVNLALSLARAQLRLNLAMHFVVALLISLLCAALGALWLAGQVTAERVQGSYFAVGHLHLFLGLMSLMAIFAAMHHWFGLRYGRPMDEGLGRLHFWLSFVAMLAAFLLMQFQGFSGLLRHHWSHAQYDFAQSGQALTPVISGLAFLATGAQVLFLINLISSIWSGKLQPEESPETSEE